MKTIYCLLGVYIFVQSASAANTGLKRTMCDPDVNVASSKNPKGLSDSKLRILSSLGQDRGGGDAKLMRSLIAESKRDVLVKQVVDAFMRNDATNIRNTLGWFSRNRAILKDTPAAQAILHNMLDKGFASDIYKTEFEISKSCIDSRGKNKAAVATINAPRTSICINPDVIVKDFGPYIQDSDLVALIMHEFSHHYGHMDADHSFAAAVAQVYQEDSERENQEGSPLNYLLRD